jgi:mannose-1-phosphate guanylyltransferase
MAVETGTVLALRNLARRWMLEKAAAAAEMVRPGALWNSLVMVARARRVLELLRTIRPAEVALLEDMAFDVAALATVYDRLQPCNVAHGFLARMPEHLSVTRASHVGWSDWGTPEAIE